MPAISSEKHLNFKINNEGDHAELIKVARAFASDERLKILKYMLNKSVSVSAISKDLDMPISSVSRHIDILSEAGLIVITYQPGLKGHTKYCAQAILDAKVSLVAEKAETKSKSYIVEMPIGLYTECNVSAPCGMVGKESPLGVFDNPNIFFSPLRQQAECIWFESGSVTYTFPVTVDISEKHRISFSMEVCSDTIYFNNNWPSDITLKINGVEVLTFTSPGNFGGKRGKYTPAYWPVTSTQFGLLKKCSVDKNGVYLDNTFVHNKLTIDDLHITENDVIRFNIGVKKDAEYRGGISLFGKNFGDFDQAIIMKIT
ncbi:MAG: helix-turn-helix domain-containing protein [Clostridia bacterium]|nr:helix-turn-helix domain-containing protein [Clostridia bacterium]